MNEFVLFFRIDIITEEAQPTEEQMEIYMKDWMKWINEIAENNQLGNGGSHLSKIGRVLKPNNVVVDTPYVADNNSVVGYIIVWADNLDGATEIAKKCPILKGENTSVEIRELGSTGE